MLQPQLQPWCIDGRYYKSISLLFKGVSCGILTYDTEKDSYEVDTSRDYPIEDNYCDILTSGYDTNCSNAIKRIVPRIDMESINSIIDETPIIPKLRKNFYKIMLNARKKLLLDKSLQAVNAKQFNSESLDRLKDGKPYTEELFEQDYVNGRFDEDIALIQELRCKFRISGDVKYLDAFK